MGAGTVWRCPALKAELFRLLPKCGSGRRLGSRLSPRKPGATDSEKGALLGDPPPAAGRATDQPFARRQRIVPVSRWAEGGFESCRPADRSGSSPAVSSVTTGSHKDRRRIRICGK